MVGGSDYLLAASQDKGAEKIRKIHEVYEAYDSIGGHSRFKKIYEVYEAYHKIREQSRLDKAEFDSDASNLSLFHDFGAMGFLQMKVECKVKLNVIMKWD